MSTATAALKSTAIRISIGHEVWLDADVTTPPDATGVVVFAHGSGSSRHSPRNRFVATELNVLRMATVLADLLTAGEEQVDDRRALRFDIPLLTRRVEHLVDWVRTYNLLSTLPVGLFGASTGAAAALDSAAARPDVVRAVVSRGGRPDLATRLPLVQAPTLLIVGGDDTEVIQMNRLALRRLTCPRELAIVPGATHLFEEPGALESAASAAGAWFEKHLRKR
jgi:putative phosphoribosyl transferase